ncbi:hypothetical protein Q5752_001008 [Cryptotrichosporon argae]
MSHIPKHRQLPDKEQKLFREVLQNYELRQYKKSLKAADTILKKFPNHGETLALKALTLHSSLPQPPTVGSVPKAEEAEAMARTAIRKDMTSHITWHVLGILAKSRKDWDEASKAFNMARKQDPDNIPLIRDAIALSAHTRQHQAALEARHHYVTLRPQIRASWYALMASHELVGDVDEALRVFDSVADMAKGEGGTRPERAQVHLHVVRMCVEAGKWEQAEVRLDAAVKSKTLSLRGEASELKAAILVALGRREEAEDTYRSLLEQNPDNLAYYRGFLFNKSLDITAPLDDDARQKVLKTLAAFAETYPRSPAPRRLSLDVATDTFAELAQTYIVAGLERGIPSLFVDIKGLYRDQDKLRAVGDIVEGLVKKLEAEASLHGDDSIPPPTALLWAYYFLALHLTHPLQPTPDHARSLSLLALALKHTPTLPELYMAKARVLKRAGDAQAAAVAMEDARLLDGQDRFLNGKAAKYWLAAGAVAKAEELLAMFTKKDLTAAQDLIDMQCLWFMQAEGDAYARAGNFAMALKRYHNLFATFQDYQDDEYDFHGYCMRRYTLNAYMQLVRYEDQIRTHPAYLRAAAAAIDIYVKVADDPSLTEEKLSAEEEAERKKAAKKAQKAEQKAKKAAAATGDKTDDAPVPDDDPTGSKLLKTDSPLDAALKIWEPLEVHQKDKVETWTLGYEVFVRKGLYLRALKALRAGAAIDKEDPTLHRQLIHFRQTVSTIELPATSKAVINEALASLVPADLAPFNAAYLSSHSTSAPHILGAAQAQALLAPTDAPAVLATLEKLVDPAVPPSSAVFAAALALAAKVGADVDALRAKVRARLPLALDLAGPQEKADRVLESEVAPRPAENGA